MKSLKILYFGALRVAVVLLCVLWAGPAALRAARPAEVYVEVTGRPADLGLLMAVEELVLPPALVPGPASHEDLPAYYLAANPLLAERLEEVRSAYESGRRPVRAVTLVAGDAGSGKTFLKKEFLRPGSVGATVLKFDLRELYGQWREDGLVQLRPDLYCGQEVINHLMAVRSRSAEPVLHYLRSSAAEFIVMDSLDELHPDEYVSVLQQVERFAFDPERDFVHVVVLGRPCAFADYWADRARRKDAADVELILLNGPQLRTTGDLLVSSWNYATWKFSAQEVLHGGQTQVLGLDQFTRWSHADFALTGEFARFTARPNHELTAEVRDALVDFAQQHRMAMPMLSNLAGNTILREIVARRVCQHVPLDERSIMDEYFAAWLERDYQSDGRPSYDHPDHLSLYVHLLEQVAARYATSARIDADGYFAVAATDSVSIRYGSKLLTFSVQSILDRSGFHHTDPRHTVLRKYRFEPIWMHRYLAERWNEQLIVPTGEVVGPRSSPFAPKK